MKCASAGELIESYLDGELDPNGNRKSRSIWQTVAPAPKRMRDFANCRSTFERTRLTMIRRLILRDESECPSDTSCEK